MTRGAREHEELGQKPGESSNKDKRPRSPLHQHGMHVTCARARARGPSTSHLNCFMGSWQKINNSPLDKNPCGGFFPERSQTGCSRQGGETTRKSEKWHKMRLDIQHRTCRPFMTLLPREKRLGCVKPRNKSLFHKTRIQHAITHRRLSSDRPAPDVSNLIRCNCVMKRVGRCGDMR